MGDKYNRRGISDVIGSIPMAERRCAFCDARTELTLDHIKPVSLGGSNGPANTQILCDGCNNDKADQYPYRPGDCVPISLLSPELEREAFAWRIPKMALASNGRLEMER